MMKIPLIPIFLSSILFFSSCQSSEEPAAPGRDTFLVDPAHPVLPPPKRNPEFRSRVSKDPVAEYREKTEHPEGDFAVRLYQTAKTMYYRADVEWEGLQGTDTIKLPDLGTEPHPVLRHSQDKYSCIIGFLDNDKQFRELKLVHAKGAQLKISTLRHWVVADHYRLVSQ